MSSYWDEEQVRAREQDEVDRQRQSTGYSWPDKKARFDARRAAGLQAEEEFDLAEPKLEFEDWAEAGAPER